MLMRCWRWMGLRVADTAGPPPMRLRSSFSETSVRLIDWVAVMDSSRTRSTLFSLTGQSAGTLVSPATPSEAVVRGSNDGRPLLVDTATDKLPSGLGPFLITLAMTSPVAVLLYTILPLMMVFEGWSPVGVDDDNRAPSALGVCGTWETVIGALVAFIECSCTYFGDLGGRPRRQAVGKTSDKPVIQNKAHRE